MTIDVQGTSDSKHKFIGDFIGGALYFHFSDSCGFGSTYLALDVKVKTLQ